MDIMTAVALGIIASFAVLLLKDIKPEAAMLIGIAGGLAVLVSVLDGLYEVVFSFFEIAEKTGIDGEIFSSVLKIIGIGYVAEFAANICADGGSKGLGDKILLAGKVAILLTALPIIRALLNIITNLLT